jgi:hypothetical protein
MGRTYDAIDEPLADFLRAQHVFFVGTAPADGGHVPAFLRTRAPGR